MEGAIHIAYEKERSQNEKGERRRKRFQIGTGKIIRSILFDRALFIQQYAEITPQGSPTLSWLSVLPPIANELDAE